MSKCLVCANAHIQPTGFFSLYGSLGPCSLTNCPALCKTRSGPRLANIWMRAQATPNTTCLVVNHENITWNYYRGRDRAFLLAGALFRVGGAAALMSNRCGQTPSRAPACCGRSGAAMPAAWGACRAVLCGSHAARTSASAPQSKALMAQTQQL